MKNESIIEGQISIFEISIINSKQNALIIAVWCFFLL